MSSVGTLVHFSIPVANIDAGLNFYGALFKWKFQKMTDTYWLIEGGLGSLSLEKEAISGTMPILYFNVPSIEDGLKIAVELGAEIVLQKTDAGDGKSFFTTFRDGSGNTIGLWSKK